MTTALSVKIKNQVGDVEARVKAGNTTYAVVFEPVDGEPDEVTPTRVSCDTSLGSAPASHFMGCIIDEAAEAVREVTAYDVESFGDEPIPNEPKGQGGQR